jgi:tetratricopeptide (TPR) repeat protein
MKTSRFLLGLTILLIGTAAYGLYLRWTPPSPPQTRPNQDWQASAGDLRRLGRFDESAALLRQAYATHGDPEAWRSLLSVLEDIGDARQQVREARAFLQAFPEDPVGRWLLARGLLFAAATHPQDPQFQDWVDEADRLAAILEKEGFRPAEAPGGVVVLKMQAAFLRQRWAEADRLAAEALALGSTPGETADIVSLRFDLALRAGRLKEAEGYLDQALAMVESWDQPSYYQLRTFREEALIVREAFFDQPFTAADLDRLQLLHQELRERGFVDPTLPQDDEASRTQEAMRAWVSMRESGNRQEQLQMLEAQLASPPAHKPRCFYSEAVASPFRPVYLHFLAGKVAVDLGLRDQARRHFQATLTAHPDNVPARQALEALR